MISLVPARKSQKLSIYLIFNSDFHSFHFYYNFKNISLEIFLTTFDTASFL